MKKKIILLSFIFLFVSFFSAVAAQETKKGNEKNNQTPEPILTSEAEEPQIQNSAQAEQGNQNANSNQGSDQAVQAQNQKQNQGEEAQAQTQVQIKAKNSQELQTMIQNKKEKLKKEAEEEENKKIKSIYQNQNQVKEAVHAMLAMEDIVGGIGKQISEIAREFNNSVEKTIQAEEKIQTRNKVWKFFFGGNQESADILDQEISQNQKRIAELKQLEEDCNCDNEIKKILVEQITNLELEQSRLQEVVMKEKQNKGLFGTIISWFKK